MTRLRLLLLLLLLFYGLSVVARADNKTSLLVTVATEDSLEEELTLDQLQWQLLDSRGQIRWSNDSCGYQDSVWIPGVTAGRYRLVYHNIFDQRFRKSVTVSPGTENQLVFDFRKVPSYRHHTLDKLREGEQLKLDVIRYGCSHYRAERLQIGRQNGALIASLWVSDSMDDNGHRAIEGPLRLIVRQTLDASQQEVFRKFENELRFADDCGCTSVEIFMIDSRYWKKRIRTSSCDWGGFGLLPFRLFPDLKEDYGYE